MGRGARVGAFATAVVLATGCGILVRPVLTRGGAEGAPGEVRHAAPEDELGVTLAEYEVVDGELTSAHTSADVPDDLVGLRDDVALHQEAWSLWWALAPEPWREDVTRLLIATDGDGGVLASVSPADDRLEAWTLHVDPAELDDQEELEETLVHELAHVLSLGEGQVVTDPDRPWGFETLAEARDACRPDRGVEDGCLTDDSYLAAFLDRFWPDDLLRRADAIAAATDPEQAAWELFDEDPLRFATDYAALHPVEDLAESWVTFVLYEYEDVDEEWAAKAAFFEAYPELVEARQHIWELLDIAP